MTAEMRRATWSGLDGRLVERVQRRSKVAIQPRTDAVKATQPAQLNPIRALMKLPVPAT
jgi:hypothetical protein